MSGFKLLLSLLTTNPALENSLSEGVDVTGTQRKDLASSTIIGKWDLFSFHHSSCFVDLFTVRVYSGEWLDHELITFIEQTQSDLNENQWETAWERTRMNKRISYLYSA